MKFKKKVLVLTSLSLHHQIFLNLLKSEINYMIIKESSSVKFNFTTDDPLFLKKQKLFESKYFTKNRFTYLKPNYLCKNINEKKNILRAKKFKPDLIIVFGTRKLNTSWISLFKKKIFNVHRGDPRFFRGLDSEFWAIYHDMFNNLGVCIHRVSKQLDTGDIFSYVKIRLTKKIKLHQLRFLMTLKAVNIFKKLINTKKIKLYKQNFKGRYYSAMPAIMKKICEIKFNK